MECSLNCTKLVSDLKTSSGDPKVVQTWRASGISHDEELPLASKWNPLAMDAEQSLCKDGEMLFALAKAFAAELKRFGEQLG